MLQSVTITVQVVFDDEHVAPSTLADQVEGATYDVGARNANAYIGERDTARCVICDAGMTLTDVDVAHHLDIDGNVDHDRDADHVAVAPVDCYA